MIISIETDKTMGKKNKRPWSSTIYKYRIILHIHECL